MQYNSLFFLFFRPGIRLWPERPRCGRHEAPRDPGSGPGKPEALKFDLSGCWSRRIDLAHHLVYQVDEPAGQLIVLQCRYHY